MHTGQLFIDGQWREGRGAPLQSFNPADGTLLWQGRSADVRDVHEAFLAARVAQSAWAEREPAGREALLRAYAECLRQRSEALALLIAREVGKPLWEARGEVTSMIGKIELSIRAQAERAGTRQDGAQVLRHRPHGVVAVFGPYNFPGHLPNGHIVPALLAGNAVIFKPSEQTPAVAEAMVACWQDAGLPPGLLNLLQGERDTGAAIAADGELDGLFFTGSSRTGALLHRQFAGDTRRILALEMGGNNPLIVRPLQAVDAALHDVLLSAFLSSGQRCSCARRLLLPEGDWGEAFLQRLLAATATLRVGACEDQPQPFMGPLISPRAAQQLLEAQDQLLALGARALLPMQRLPQGAAFLSPGLIEVSGIDVPDEEHFGPLLQLIRYRELDQAIAIANATRYGLAAGFFGEDEAEYRHYARRARVGVLNWNRPTTGASGALPFGGTGASGNHHPSAWYAADYCNYPVASQEAPQASLPAQLPPGMQL
ncbi:succinylglutamic semialdehyde dehydrogenase [Solimonas aquatica]|uniref:N-succinylglutamate 5-semialdehyde dehydrogenase n=1 Tax=Solimonas aquatica TaxID=489703 RepID=A0A1H9KG85_9GAMM|nr:succinylglutamate-semialdehyde dehydrogenase [Solimonas aquatica]SEQ98132.1 succinylglutamic semialdehyde dehydrogenase [Solimonas aquatica]